MSDETYAEGTILTPSGFIKGYILFDQDGIIEWGKGKKRRKLHQSGLITPLFINGHTHIGDSFLWEKHKQLPRNIKELVAPPDGLKHRALQHATDKVLTAGMKTAIQIMKSSGTKTFWDFRENGLKGVKLLQKAIKNSTLHALIMARPNHLEVDKNELIQLLRYTDGIGLSSMNEWSFEDLQTMRGVAQKHSKLFALHVSEQQREDIGKVIELNPDYIIHMTQGTLQDFNQLAQHNIPVVVCPHSNQFFGMKPPFETMKKAGVTIILGTDNAMIQPPNILEEARYLLDTKIYKIEDILSMITYTPRKVLNSKPCIQFPASKLPFVILEPQSLAIKEIVTFTQDGVNHES